MTIPQFAYFNGSDDPRTWLNSARLAIRIVGHAEPGWLVPAVQVELLCSHLKGKAAVWRDSLSQNGAQLPWADPEAFAQAFISAHTPINDAELAREELWACKQSGTITDYVDTFRGIVLRIPRITDDECLDRFVFGLAPSVKQQVKMAAPQTLAAAYTAAQHAVPAVAADAVTAAPAAAAAMASSEAAAAATGALDDPMEVNTVEAVLNALGIHNNQVGCWYCHHTGHIRTRCPNTVHVMCQLCGKWGHGAAHCDSHKGNNTHR
jgi:hypothetical protein